MKPIAFPMLGNLISLIDISKTQPIIPTREKNTEIPNCLKYLKMGASENPINKSSPINNVITLFSFKKSFANEITTNKAITGIIKKERIGVLLYPSE